MVRVVYVRGLGSCTSVFWSDILVWGLTKKRERERERMEGKRLFYKVIVSYNDDSKDTVPGWVRLDKFTLTYVPEYEDIPNEELLPNPVAPSAKVYVPFDEEAFRKIFMETCSPDRKQQDAVKTITKDGVSVYSGFTRRHLPVDSPRKKEKPTKEKEEEEFQIEDKEEKLKTIPFVELMKEKMH